MTLRNLYDGDKPAASELKDPYVPSGTPAQPANGQTNSLTVVPTSQPTQGQANSSLSGLPVQPSDELKNATAKKKPLDLEKLANSLDKEIILKEYEIDSKNMRSLMETLSKNHNFRKIDCSGINLTDLDLIKFCSKFPPKLRELDISHNGISQDGVERLADVLKPHTFLTKLNLSNNNIGIQGLRTLLEVIKNNECLLVMNYKKTSTEESNEYIALQNEINNILSERQEYRLSLILEEYQRENKELKNSPQPQPMHGQTVRLEQPANALTSPSPQQPRAILVCDYDSIPLPRHYMVSDACKRLVDFLSTYGQIPYSGGLNVYTRLSNINQETMMEFAANNFDVQPVLPDSRHHPGRSEVVDKRIIKKIYNFAAESKPGDTVVIMTGDGGFNNDMLALRNMHHLNVVLIYPPQGPEKFVYTWRNNYDLCLMSDHIKIEPNKLYLKKVGMHISFTVMTPKGEVIRDFKLDQPLAPEVFELGELNKMKDIILHEASKTGHIRKNNSFDWYQLLDVDNKVEPLVKGLRSICKHFSENVCDFPVDPKTQIGCKFLHLCSTCGSKEHGAISCPKNTKPKPLCGHFAKGNCKYGKRCNLSHDCPDCGTAGGEFRCLKCAGLSAQSKLNNAPSPLPGVESKISSVEQDQKASAVNPSGPLRGTGVISGPVPEDVLTSNKRCPGTFFCVTGLECKYYHLPPERVLFLNNGGKGIKKICIEACTYGEECPRRSTCTFAHNQSEFVCMYCAAKGDHLGRHCPKRTEDRKQHAAKGGRCNPNDENGKDPGNGKGGPGGGNGQGGRGGSSRGRGQGNRQNTGNGGRANGQVSANGGGSNRGSKRTRSQEATQCLASKSQPTEKMIVSKLFETKKTSSPKIAELASAANVSASELKDSNTLIAGSAVAEQKVTVPVADLSIDISSVIQEQATAATSSALLKNANVVDTEAKDAVPTQQKSEAALGTPKEKASATMHTSAIISKLSDKQDTKTTASKTSMVAMVAAKEKTADVKADQVATKLNTVKAKTATGKTEVKNATSQQQESKLNSAEKKPTHTLANHPNKFNFRVGETTTAEQPQQSCSCTTAVC